MNGKPYGSGYFGEWIEDEFGLPAYRYTCNQVKDPKAKTPVNPALRGPTDHSHQVGNDRLVAVASNYGYVQVRQDEGSPKYLNEYDPARNQYAGGFGYLTDGRVTLSTFYQGQDEGFERTFGVGYLRKTVRTAEYGIDQVVFAPFGDDPLLISQVTISNCRDVPVDLRWIEYWGCQMHQFSFRATIYAGAKKNIGNVAEIRRKFSERFAQRISRLDNGGELVGLITETKFKGWSITDKAKWAALQAVLSTVGRKAFGGAIKTPADGRSFEDLTPPPTFLVSLDAPAQGMETEAGAFFGKGGVSAPDGLNTPLSGKAGSRVDNGALLLERRFRLGAGEKRTLYFAYGYLPEGVELNSLLEKYKSGLDGLWARSSEEWKKNRIKLVTKDEPWVDRELLWHNYYLRSNLTYDSFFKEHILSQGHVYQYILGFQGAARDPLQHALPFIFTETWIVKEIIRYTLKEVLPDGEIPYAITGNGMIMPSRFHPSDQEMWLLWLASEYVLATRDKAFLDEKINTYPDSSGKSQTESVLNLLARCYRHLVDVTGTGEHGLQRLSSGDWNDGIVLENVSDKDRDKVRKYGESVLNAAMATYALDIYSRMLKFVGDARMADDAMDKAEKQRKAVRSQWNGKWFRRAWLSPELGWVGDEQLWLEPQPWAIIGGAASPEQSEILVKNIDELLRRPSPIGAMLLNEPPKGNRSPAGIATNGGIWPSINGTLIWALALVDGSMAWDEWKKNTLAMHAEAYPEVWYGIWSGPDTYNSVLSKYPGHTYFDESLVTGTESSAMNAFHLNGLNWTDFPVMNMHPHAWLLYSTAKLMGVEFTPEGVSLAPVLPKDEFSFESPLLGLKKSRNGYSGWYAPKFPGEWQVTLCLKREEIGRFSKMEVNGIQQPIAFDTEGRIVMSGEGSEQKPLSWSIS